MKKVKQRDVDIQERGAGDRQERAGESHAWIFSRKLEPLTKKHVIVSCLVTSFSPRPLSSFLSIPFLLFPHSVLIFSSQSDSFTPPAPPEMLSRRVLVAASYRTSGISFSHIILLETCLSVNIYVPISRRSVASPVVSLS